MDKSSKIDRHILDPFIKIFGLKRFCLPASAIAGCAGVFLSMYFDNWDWLARFGSLIAVFGLLLTMSPIFVRGLYKAHSQKGIMANKNPDDGTTITTSPRDREIGGRVAAGIVVAILGTIVSAFGDFFSQLIQ